MRRSAHRLGNYAKRHRRSPTSRAMFALRPMDTPKLLRALSPTKRNAHEALHRYMKIPIKQPRWGRLTRDAVEPATYKAFRIWRADWLRQCLIYGPKWHMDALRHRAREEIAGADAYSVVSGLRDVL